MNARTGLLARWFFFSVLTFLPVILGIGMFVFRMGFVRWIWIASLFVAFISFFKAQQTIAGMRGLEEDPKLHKWLREARRRTAASNSKQRDSGYQPPSPSPENTKRALKRFRRASFWRKQDVRSMQREVHDLFQILGCSVKNVAPHGKLGPGLLVSNTTYVGFATDGASSTHTDARNLDAMIASSPNWQTAILISPRGIKRSARAFAKKSGLIVLDAESLVRLSRQEPPK